MRKRIIKGIIYELVEAIFAAIYIILKLTIIFEFAWPLFLSIRRYLPCYNNISKGITKFKKTRNCYMVLDINTLYTIQKKDYFSEHISISKQIVDVMFSIDKDLINIDDEIKTDTNKFFLKFLRNKYKDDDNIFIESAFLYKSWQPFEKLLFINPFTLWKNIFNFKLAKILFRRELIYKVTIKRIK